MLHFSVYIYVFFKYSVNILCHLRIVQHLHLHNVHLH